MPGAAGLKTILNPHPAPGLTWLVHKFCATLKSPSIVTLVTVIGPFVEGSTMTFATDCAEVPTVTLPKPMLDGDNETPGAAPVPVNASTNWLMPEPTL